ncbi:HlyD family secretion protein [Bacteroidota bacterium]
MKTFLSYIALLSIILIPGCGNNGDEIIEESGTIEATNIIVSSKVAGSIDKILLDEGALADEGDTILIIDHELYDIQLKQASAGRDFAKAQLDLLVKGSRKEDVKQAEEMLKLAEANFKLAKENKERFDNLYESQSITKKQYDEVSTGFEVAQAQYNAAKENFAKIKNIARPEELVQARAKLEQSEAAVELIQKSINDCYVTAPMAGHIVKNFVEVGESVSPLSSLFKISDLSTVELRVYVSEENLGMVKLGQRAEISTDSYRDKSYEGKVVYISPEAEFTPKNIQTKDERTKLVFAVKIEIPNENFELKAGMPADAVIYL